MEVTGKIVEMSRDFSTGRPKITFQMEHEYDAVKLYEDLKEAPKLRIDISRYRGKRSLNANGYMWELCDRLADAIGNTKNEVYRNAIREVGVFKDFPPLPLKDASTLICAWQRMGTGWCAEKIDYAQNGDDVVVRCYYGSSQYNTKQMSRLLDYIIAECKEVGVQVETPNEVARLISLWGEESV